jgi:hypothetical protein
MHCDRTREDGIGQVVEYIVFFDMAVGVGHLPRNCRCIGKLGLPRNGQPTLPLHFDLDA